MNELQIFNNPEFGQIRTTEISGQPFFVANDVAVALGYKRPADAVAQHCKGSVKHRYQTNGGLQEVKVIPESDIYRLIIKSKLPSAERFEAWVMEEVLPSIRKNGGYIAGQENMSDAELLAKAVLVAQKQIEEKNKLIEERDKQIDEMRPASIFAGAVSASDSSILIRDLAKMIRQNGVDIGEKRLYAWMRENGYICKGSTRPTQRAMDMNLFEIVVQTVERGKGLPIETMTTRVSGKGQVYFVNKFLAEQAV